MRKENLGEVLRKNAVTIMFVLLCIGGMAVSGQTPTTSALRARSRTAALGLDLPS